MKKLIDLFLYPKTILRYGFSRFNEDQHQKKCFNAHGINQLPTIDLSDFMGVNDVMINPYSFLDGTSLITDIVLLKSLARNYENCNYLEIGSWRGESISNVATVAKKCTSVTLSDEEMRKMNFGEKFIEVHGIYSKNIENITTHYANSLTFDFNSLGEKFDLIFVDGDHTYDGVLSDTKKIFPLLKDKNSTIVWHDYGYSAETVRPSVLKAILDAIPTEKHKHLYHVSNTMSAIYCENIEFKTYITAFPTKPINNFKLQISIERTNNNTNLSKTQ